jgi:hypothetical protein
MIRADPERRHLRLRQCSRRSPERLAPTDERATVVRIAAQELGGGVFAPRRHDLVDEPRALRKVNSQSGDRRLFAYVHVASAFDHVAIGVVERDVELALMHVNRI